MTELRNKLDAGERVPVNAEQMQEAFENVRHVGINHKLAELAKLGVVEARRGTLMGSTRYFYRGRPVKIHADYVGKSNWRLEDHEDMEFVEPHDIVVDKKSKQIICLARS